MTDRNPRLDYSDSRDDIAETYPKRQNDPRDYGPRAKGVIKSVGAEVVPVDEGTTESEDISGGDRGASVGIEESNSGPEQLQLLDVPGEVPLRFRLSKQTRETGLAHIAKIREQRIKNE
jgi:hypothetical protein